MILRSISSPQAGANVCSNLRPASLDSEALTPVEWHKMLITGSFCFGLSTSEGVLAYDDSRIICITATGHYTVTDLEGWHPLTFADGGCRIMVACQEGWLGLKMAGDRWTREGILNGWDAMPHIYATPAEEVSVTIPGRPLRKSCADGALLSAADAADISDSVVEAHARIAALTAASGAMLQPRAVGYRVLDAAGNVLFSSPMLIYGSPQLAGAWTIKANQEADTIEAITITATGYRLHLRVPPQPSELLRAIGARIEVVASPQMQAFDDRASRSVRRLSVLARPSLVSVALPGAELGKLSPGAPSAMDLAARLASCDAETRVLCTIERPFSANDATERLIPAEAAALDDDRAALRRVWAWKPRRQTAAQAWARSPHMLRAAACASGSGASLMAGLTVMPFRGYELPMLAVETERKAWRAVVTTTFDDGSIISQAAEGADHAPTRLSPLLSFPAPGAVRLSVQLSVEGEPLRVAAFDLRPDMRCRDAVWMASEIASPQWREVQGSLVVPSDTAGARHFPAAIAVCAQGQPLCVHTAKECAGHELRAAVPVAKSPQAWDFGRARFLLGGDGGLQCAVVSADRREVSVTLIDPRPVAHKRALTASTDGEAAALAGSDLLRVKANVVSTIATGLEADIAAWDPTRRELWAFPAPGDDQTSEDGTVEARVYPLGRLGEWYTARVGAVHDVSDSPVALLAATHDGIARVSADTDEDPDSSLVPVAWSGTVKAPRVAHGSGLAAAVVPIAATCFEGTVTVAHAHAPGPEGVIARYRCSGPVLSPLRLLIRSYPASDFTITIEGLLSADGYLRAPFI